MIKKLFKRTLAYSLGDFIVVAVNGFLLLPYYTRVLALDEYGVFGVINASIGFMGIVVHFGMVSTYSRHYFLCKTQREKEIYTGNLIFVHLVLALIIIFAAFAGKDFLLGSFLDSIEYDMYFYSILAIPFFSFMSSLYSVYLRMVDEPYKFVGYQVLTVAIFVSLIFAFQFFQSGALDSIVLALFVSGVFMWCIAIYKLPFRFDISRFAGMAKSILIYSIPICFTYLMYFALTKFNILYLQAYIDKDDLSFFVFSMQLSTIITILAASAGKAIQPFLFGLDSSEIVGMSEKIAGYYKAVLLTMLILFYSFSESIILIFAPPEYLESYGTLNILVISAFLYSYRSVEGNLFFYFNRPRYGLCVTTVSALVVVGLSLSFVPKYGAIASAYSIVVGGFVALITSKYLYYVILKERDDAIQGS